MKISDIDANFKHTSVNAPDVVWRSAYEAPFGLSGVYYEESEGRYRRMPNEVAERVSPGVKGLSLATAGGQLRFATDADYIALKVVAPPWGMMQHMPIYGQFGFGVYEDGYFIGTLAPTVEAVSATAPFAYEAIINTRRVAIRDGERRMREYTLCFPLYSGVTELFVGLNGAARLEAPRKHAYDGRVLFYGSSITQGGCTSHSGNDYVNMLSLMLDTEILNLGFSGNARAEDAMIEYLASLSPSVFVLDYDHNAPTAEHLAATHEKLFLAFRAAHPDIPVIMISQPDFDYRPMAPTRRDIIRRTYENAVAAGDERVFFIDGETLFEREERGACTLDGCHPNDLGFYRMAKTIYPVLRNCLEM